MLDLVEPWVLQEREYHGATGSGPLIRDFRSSLRQLADGGETASAVSCCRQLAGGSECNMFVLLDLAVTYVRRYLHVEVFLLRSHPSTPHYGILAAAT